MLIHCLTITFTKSAADADIEAFCTAVAALPQQVGVPMRTRQGRDLGHRPNNADYAVVSEFDSAEDFYTYLEHPAHTALPVHVIDSAHGVQFLVDNEPE